ncbi:MAG: 30S ribosomal protein S15 [Nitrososphaerota archaeon]|nr:30S ribosomal protein S15 [Nitrososphaerales archaeon]MDW8045136.1 30S ribosomal protein S15 [Nitrososphaerota archaeon]
MARMYSHRRGKSHSTRLASRHIPSWVTYSPDEITALIVKMAKDGLTPSEIGVKLRDEYGIPLVKPILGKSITEILEENNLLPPIPEDLDRLLKRAVKIQAHLKVHKGDRKSIHALELLEARIHRLSEYYKSRGKLPPNWKYSAVVAQLA